MQNGFTLNKTFLYVVELKTKLVVSLCSVFNLKFFFSKNTIMCKSAQCIKAT